MLPVIHLSRTYNVQPITYDSLMIKYEHYTKPRTCKRIHEIVAVVHKATACFWGKICHKISCNLSEIMLIVEEVGSCPELPTVGCKKTQMVKSRWIKPDKSFLDTGEMLNESLLIR